MSDRVKVFPHLPDCRILFKFRSPDAIHNTFFLKSVVVFIKNDGSYPLVLVLGQDPDQIKNNIFTVLFSAKQMKYPKKGYTLSGEFECCIAYYFSY